MPIKLRVSLVILADLALVFLLSRLSVMLALCFVIAQILTQVASFDTTIFLHRYLTHEGITYLHPRVVAVCKFFIWLLTGIDWREWAAVHLKHHAFTDREGDPHSPTLLGWVRVQLFNAYYYAREARAPGTVEKYAPHIQRFDGVWGYFPFYVGWMGPLLGTVALCYLLGLGWGLLTGLMHAVMYIGGSGSVNSLCHWFGYKNFDNTATNLPEVAVGTAGEGEHNNHHAFPRSAKLSARPDEIDPAWPVIKWLVRRGWAKVFQSAIDKMEAEASQKYVITA